ncbi:MAG: type VI secretion system tip protein TssI/VgrG [Pseudomonadota bacterium]
MAEYSQNERRANLTVGGDDLLLVLHQMTGDEELSGEFQWNVEALSEDSDLDLQSLLGENANVSVESVEGIRHFNGVISAIRWVGPEENGNRYDLTLRSWLHLASLRSQSRIFHNVTVVDILQKVFEPYAGYGSPHVDMSSLGSYPVLEYTVQYNESDANFARRQMERFGITWHWVFAEKGHTLVLTDIETSHPTVPGGTRPWYPVRRLHQGLEEHFYEWKTGTNLVTNTARLTEYNFKTPNVMQEVTNDASYPGDVQYENYEWPGDYLDPTEGGTMVMRRAEATAGQGPRIKARGNISGLAAGFKVEITGQELPGTTGHEFMCVSARHTLRTQAYGSSAKESTTEEDYTAEYVMQPAGDPIRPLRRAKRPVITGCQTAMVVGDGEIDCDDYGRILVRFHWDLAGANSMRCRVMQHSASNTYGGMVIPRIGMEAVVEFLEGDPDKPLVTGCVYNANTPRPYDLPGHKTKHVIRADSHEGSGFNEISFEAQSGQENLHVHAQKDNTFKVLNDQTFNIGMHLLSNIGANRSEVVGANKLERVHLNKTTTVGGIGAGLFKVLQPLIVAGGKHMEKAVKKAGQGGSLAQYAKSLAKDDDLVAEAAAVRAASGLFGAEAYRSEGGKQQHGLGGILGGILGGVTKLGGSGSMNQIFERFLNNSVGIGSSEHVGVGKNLVVGNVFSTSVGKIMSTLVGEEHTLEAKKKIKAHTEEHVLLAKKKFTIAGPGGSITIDNAGVTIKTKHLVVKSPKVDFKSGSPGQVEALSTDKPFAQECKDE